MRISLNLATRPFTDLGPALGRLRIAAGVLALLCILFGIGLHLFDREAAEARARDHSLDGQIARVQAERTAAQAYMDRPDNAQLLKQVDFLNQRFDEKAFSWTLAMEAMETVLPGGVQVTAIEPLRDKDGHITVRLRVVGPRDRAVDLVSNLEQSRRFLQPRIVGESAESSNGPAQRQEPISASNRFEFEILADYNPPTPVERSPGKKSQKTLEKAPSKPAHHSAASAPAGGASATAPRATSRQARPAPGVPQTPDRHAPAIPQQKDRPPYAGQGSTGTDSSSPRHVPQGGSR
jgi:type IV pilus assembly protein PilN